MKEFKSYSSPPPITTRKSANGDENNNIGTIIPIVEIYAVAHAFNSEHDRPVFSRAQSLRNWIIFPLSSVSIMKKKAFIFQNIFFFSGKR